MRIRLHTNCIDGYITGSRLHYAVLIQPRRLPQASAFSLVGHFVLRLYSTKTLMLALGLHRLASCSVDKVYKDDKNHGSRIRLTKHDQCNKQEISKADTKERK